MDETRPLMVDEQLTSTSSVSAASPQVTAGSSSSTSGAEDVSAKNGGGPDFVETRWWEEKPKISRKKPTKKVHSRSAVLQPACRYEHVAMVMDTDPSRGLQVVKRTITPYQCVHFWPFVGPKRLPEPLDKWENCVAVCGDDRLLVAKIHSQEPWTTVCEMKIEDDLYTLAWSFDPYALKPIIAVAGKSGLVYIINVLDRQVVRILSGHGDSILSLDFSPLCPHILASASADKTTRIWNILGADLTAPDPGVYPSKNYPMAMADEGDVVVAILAGEGRGGHQAKVVGVAFHPTYHAVATCGEDFFVKIWALPELPPPIPSTTPATGYQPHVVHFPVFSTNRIHNMCIDCIAWISNDVLISRGSDDIRCWQWLGLDRYFQPGSPLAHGNMIIRDDYDRSHSFRLIVNYNQERYIGSQPIWYFRFGIHHAFDAEEEPSRLVNGTLLAIGDRASASPSILLFNPLLAQDVAPPPFIATTRMPCSGDAESESEYQAIATAQERYQSRARFPPAVSQTFPAALTPWQLVPRGYQAAAARSPSLKNCHGMVRHCAISPRGAQFIVGVGEGQNIFVYQLKAR